MGLRLLHTADWHLGHTLHGVERDFEHASFVEWLLDTLERERIDAVLVSGDIFDAANPPASATALWYRFLAQAWRRTPKLQVVVVGGNHDSAARLDAPDPLLRALGRLTVIGGLPRRDGQVDFDRLAVPLEDGSGKVAGWVAAIPFLRSADVSGGGCDGVQIEGARRVIHGTIEAARHRRQPGQALLAMAHCHLAGGAMSDLSERKLVIGNQPALPADVFPADLPYVALGHLHLPQQIDGRASLQYAGSVLPLSFPERKYEHQVSLVELEGERVASAQALRVPRAVDVLSIPDDGPRLLDEVLGLLRVLPARGNGPDHGRPYLEVHVALDRPEPALRQILDEALKGKEARLVRIAPPRILGSGEALADAGDTSLLDLLPEDVFRRKYERDYGSAPPDDLLAAFHELHDRVFQEAR
jgi:exonuclease SbcD